MVNLTCDICLKDIHVESYDGHYALCLANQYDSIDLINNQTEVLKSREVKLEDCHKQAIKYCQKKSKIFSNNIYPNLLIKFQSNGYTEEELKQTIKYVQSKVQIVIHFSPERTLQFLCEDDHYRNQFETLTKGNAVAFEALNKESNGRFMWETKLFNGLYNNSNAYSKVKYGSLNILNNPDGVKCCHGYGNSYIKLKKEVNKRASFVFGDSAAQEIHIQTFDHCNNILFYISDKLLEEVIKVATGKIEYSDFNFSPYIEAQIHGPVRLSEDVESIHINNVCKKTPHIFTMLDTFKKTHNVDYYWMN
jgi:hypothetical protein